ncbi:hypothetical protein [Streptomyces sp. NPDC000134]|uniref:hypothetical protein n=1 Tax=Streptomyces sp. NPDC000134 TaxID=3364536 RepID=UPI0036911665
MDPISVALLAALAGGLGGEAGRQTWEGLVALVRRPFRRADGEPGAAGAGSGPSSGEPELAALAQAPDDPARAHALSTALAVRAALDEEFRRALEDWRQGARQTAERDGGVQNRISGGTYYGPVVQARDISGGSFTAQPPPPRD